MAGIDPRALRAIRKVSRSGTGRKFDRYARTQFHMSGGRLAAKQIKGESGGRMGAVSSAGARGTGQFMPATRQSMIQRYGIDPWRSQHEAVKALELYDLEHGVAGYNPGMPTYTKYVTGQKLSGSEFKAATRGAPGGGGGGGRPVSVRGPGHVDVSLPSKMIPGVSHAADRAALRAQFLTGGKLTVGKLLALKQQETALPDEPAQKVLGDLKVTRVGGRSQTIGAGKRAGGGGGGGPAGKVSFAPSANRAGVPESAEIKRALRGFAGAVGHPITVGTGTNHNRLTVNGNVSDHWDGHAADIPAAGSHLTRLGQKALAYFGMSAPAARRTQGGLFNLQWHGHRVQVIFNTNEGGNHYNHLHIGVR